MTPAPGPRNCYDEAKALAWGGRDAPAGRGVGVSGAAVMVEEEVVDGGVEVVVNRCGVGVGLLVAPAPPRLV